MMIYIHVFLIWNIRQRESWSAVSEINTGNALNGLIKANNDTKLVMNNENNIKYFNIINFLLYTKPR